MYLNKDVFLDTETARHLYHEVAADLPVIDFHTHLNQQEILDDHRFADLWELWLKHDHYKWRLMRGCGVEEKFITGDASPWEKFEAFAKIMPMAVGNPVHHWAHLELQRVFSIHTVLSADTAETIWNNANQQLADDPSLSVRGLLEKFKVKLVCTTDDPAADLSVHGKLGSEDTVVTLPTFRPDLAMAVDRPEVFTEWIQKLQACVGQPISDFQSLIDALKKRHADFHAVGCRLSDHGLPFCPNGYDDNTDRDELDNIFTQATCGRTAANKDEQELFASAIMSHVAAWNAEKDWTMQLHLGPLRNVNPTMFERTGPDSGFDTMGAWPQTEALVDFLGALQKQAALPRTIVYNLNPNESAAICCAAQNFQDASCPGKVQYGPAWWHLDHKRGIIEQLDLLMSLGAIGTSVGMLTDSRSFTSYVRHEYFRRLLCQLIGQAVEAGEIPDDSAQLNALITHICYENASRYFNWPTAL
ncbi:glucuronate isomerase [Verrucomicrobiaceae bacterium 5K15]|uniref:Uronate isomerase n=1 Tax=Oceaniferula flava TaxID=2800421 RepID=A0AAE2SAT9_9BACT|nr:glucuronate isomerase [Oceaniferula flavus]MBK1854017.1 glucuronate isomerase [Oceaniferula flavus]MBM1135323.1 glucuronate isomerase [Oceaniferula flavus]